LGGRYERARAFGGAVGTLFFFFFFFLTLPPFIIKDPHVSINEMDNVFHDREGVCPMDAMRKVAEV